MTTMIRPRLALAALGACLTLLAGGLSISREPRPSPPFAGSVMPEPPRQNEPWAAPSVEIQASLVTACEALFQDGMADPRGCEYRIVEVGTGSCWSGDAGVATTHGWVLPAKDGEKQRFAVCWNGLVYPLVSVGGPADLKADILQLIQADEEMRARYARDNPGSKFERWGRAWQEDYSVSHETVLPLKACLLLRLGEGDLARQLWLAWQAGLRADRGSKTAEAEDPYLMLATDWVWALFDRAVCAHMRGDDALALASARAIVPAEKAVATDAKKRGFKNERFGARADKPDEHPYLNFLEPLPALLADQERRAQQNKKAPPRPNRLDQEEAQRIDSLINNLQNVAARQMGQPGGVSLAGDPVVQSLINEGDAAVEPLLHCLETDTRLTRSVHFHRDFFQERSIIGVHEAAYEALAGILQTSFFGAASTGDDLTARGMEGRRHTAGLVRAYWKQFKGVPLDQRWYLTLADDHAAPSQWLQAAENIVQPGDVTVTRGSMFGAGWILSPRRDSDEKPKLRGDRLRDRKDPSVAELMARRIGTLCQTGRGWERTQAVLGACKLAKDLSDWDEKTALPELNRMIQECKQEITRNSGASDQLHLQIVNLILLRVHMADPSALNDYAAWIRGVSPKDAGPWCQHVLQPMWENPDHPAVAAAADFLFNDTRSPWAHDFARSYETRDLIGTPLVGLDAFRKRLLAELVDADKAGTITPREGGSAMVEVVGGYSAALAAVGSEGDPQAPKPGTTVTFRVCDYYAWQLGSLDGMPLCKLYWPQDQRDQAVAACAAALRQYGERFRLPKAGKRVGDWGERAQMRFPPLDNPATAQDVKNGLAVFSLEGMGKVQMRKLPARPMTARWTTLSESPVASVRLDLKTGAAEKVISYQQDGLVWQAEEVMQEGKWVRYYGFVGAHRIARVPAEEIEFPPEDPYFWDSLSHGIDCQIADPGTIVKDGMTTVTRLGVDSPLIVHVKLRNRLGVEQTVPAEFVRKGEGGKNALHTGIELRLHHAAAGAAEGVEWQELTPKATTRFTPEGGARMAAPAEEFAEFQFDLNDGFEIAKPGEYRLQIVFNSRNGGIADGASREIKFALAAADVKKP